MERLKDDTKEVCKMTTGPHYYVSTSATDLIGLCASSMFYWLFSQNSNPVSGNPRRILMFSFVSHILEKMLRSIVMQ